MTERKKILIVDDSSINRQILCKILKDDYDIIQAENGKTALVLLEQYGGRIAVILLDISMPVMNGYEFLDTVQALPRFSGIPIIVMTQHEGEETEIAALSLGASDFLTKPYRPTIIRQRIANIIKLRETASVVNAVERDAITGIYNRDEFYRRADEMLSKAPERNFYILSVDLERFKLVNDLFGVDEGDKLLKYVAKLLQMSIPEDGICGKLSGDIFFAIIPEDHCEDIEHHVLAFLTDAIKDYPLNISLSLKYGVYRVKSRGVPINVMCDRAKLAADSIKGKYDIDFAYYEESLRDVLLAEQQIINDMKTALRKREFVIYFQPIYNLSTETMTSAEALVRWVHPQKGLISPNQFIPLFEKNGFITDLDFYVWDYTCRAIREWIDNGYDVVPIAVNVSRMDIYDPNLPDILMGIINKYSLTPQHINLEITETAYTESPVQLIKAVHALNELGFIIEMDDFGSGYSSLNMLSELPLDILKIDMQFLHSHTEENRKGNILNFIISLAKWLGLSVVAEGIETHAQMMFLRGMGCNYGQGYYFSKPLSEKDFGSLLCFGVRDQGMKTSEFVDLVKLEEIWNPLSQFNVIFNSCIGALAIFECVGENVKFIRGNDCFFEELGLSGERFTGIAYKIIEYLHPEDRSAFLMQLDRARGGCFDQACISRWYTSSSRVAMRWLSIRVKGLHSARDRALLLLAVSDVTLCVQLKSQIAGQAYESYNQRMLFQKNFDNVPTGMAQFESDACFAFINVNKAMLKLLGFEDANAFFAHKRYFLDYVALPCKDEVKAELSWLANLGDARASDMAYQLLTCDNRKLWVKNFVCIIDIGTTRLIQCSVSPLPQPEYQETEAAVALV
ncbi:two-component system response regulator [Oscillospiraceae bacterium LTW-04]|nr:EAL domain-containing protein [Oscillospiraceae bacterium MB24-C1]